MSSIEEAIRPAQEALLRREEALAELERIADPYSAESRCAKIGEFACFDGTQRVVLRWNRYVDAVKRASCHVSNGRDPLEALLDEVNVQYLRRLFENEAILLTATEEVRREITTWLGLQ